MWPRGWPFDRYDISTNDRVTLRGIDLERLRLDPFALALGALGALTLAFFSVRNGAAVVMCGLCIAGLIAARLIGFSNRALVPLALGVIAILWAVWVAEPIDSDAMSAVAHTAGGGLVGWALAEFLRERIEAPAWTAIAVAAVFALTVMWEIGEWAGDVVLTTDLDPNSLDSILDVFFGTLGGAAAIALAWLIGGRRSSRPRG